MNRIGIAEQITALVDNELNDQKQIDTLNSLIKSDDNLRFEYQVQSIIKNVVRTRFEHVTSPSYLKSKIQTQIVNDAQKRYSLKPIKFWDFLFRPQVAFPAVAALCIILISYFFIFDRSNFEEIVQQQNGNNNMFIQARSNFNKIIQGKLPVQLFSKDPYTIKEYFKKEGVQYATTVPMFDDMELVGATVSEAKGEKFAHHVYKKNDGKLVYFYQVKEKCITKDKCLSLSKDLLSMLNEGKYFTYSKDGRSFLVWKNEENICIIVSNDDVSKLSSKFVSQKY